MMHISISLEIHPFSIPEHVFSVQKPGLRQEGFNPTIGVKYHLSELDEETLDKLCNEFRKSVFEIAGFDDDRL